MTTYLILNIAFFFSLVLFLPKAFNKPTKAWLFTLFGLVILTAVFDPLMISLNFFEYAPSKIIGIKFLGAPIEDFFYALYAACVVPMVWNKLGEQREKRR